MLLKYFYDPQLAHASYMVGCQKTGEAVVIDAGRDIRQYLDAAKREGMKIVGAADTHIHADYVSGARELADRVGARLYVSDEGPPEWKFEYAQDYDHVLLKDGDTFSVGKIEFQVLHTPGHTPESICFVLTDKGGGANRPMGIFTGDFVFVGSIGRPDLLEEAAGMKGTAEPGARELFHSINRFKTLPDWLQVWPAHGAGSACGKGLGAIPSSTVGYEKLFNPALQFTDEQEFVDYILSEQPEAPRYFAVMKRVNKVGPEILGVDHLPPKLETGRLNSLVQTEQVVDTRSGKCFLAGHLPGSISIATRYLAMWGGTIIDYNQPLYLIASENDLEEANRVLRKIGVENIAGWFDADEVASAGMNSGMIPEKSPQELSRAIADGTVQVVDVRGATEWRSGHIPQAEWHFLPKVPAEISQDAGGKTVVFQCQSGGRSIIGASLARRAGLRNVVNMAGGFSAWRAAGLPVEIPGAVEPKPV